MINVQKIREENEEDLKKRQKNRIKERCLFFTFGCYVLLEDTPLFEFDLLKTRQLIELRVLYQVGVQEEETSGGSL